MGEEKIDWKGIEWSESRERIRYTTTAWKYGRRSGMTEVVEEWNGWKVSTRRSPSLYIYI